MKRWILKAGVTDADNLVLEDAPLPEPGPGEVRIRVHAVSLNYRDQLVLNGPFGRLPGRDLVPVSDMAGEIEALGPDVAGWAIGDRVVNLYFPGWVSGPPKPGLGMGLGALDEDGVLAEYVVLPATRIARAPASLGYAGASTLPCAGVTAWNALYGDHPIGPDSTVLVLGSGGVSLFALTFAKAAGAKVSATSSQNGKLDRMKALGAAEVVNYRETPEWGAAIWERTGGVDKVVDVGGAGTLNQSLAAVGYGGEVALVGLFTEGDAPPDAWALMGKGAVVRGIATGNASMYEALAQAIDTHGIAPPIDRHFSFYDAKDAYRAQTSPDLFGKIVLDVV